MNPLTSQYLQQIRLQHWNWFYSKTSLLRKTMNQGIYLILDLYPSIHLSVKIILEAIWICCCNYKWYAHLTAWWINSMSLCNNILTNTIHSILAHKVLQWKNFCLENINLKGTIHNKREVNESSFFFMISIIDIFQKSISKKMISMVVNCCTQIFIKKF